TWSALIDWEEDGLGGSVSRERGTDGPHLAVLTSWLVREAESGEPFLSTGGFGVQHHGVVVAQPLRRGDSAPAGLPAPAVPRRPPGSRGRTGRTSGPSPWRAGRTSPW